MEKITKHLRLVGREEISLGELIHREVRKTIELAVEEELEAVLGARPYERVEQRRGYRNGSRQRTLTGPTGPVNLTIPRATMNTTGGREEWRSTVVPRYQRRMREINEAVAGVYLSGSNTRRIKGALRPLLKEAPLSRSSVSRIVATFKGEMDAWRKQSLAELDVAYLYLDAIALRVRLGGRVTSVPVPAGVVVLSDGNKRLVSLEMCGSESHDAWKGFLDDLVGRKLKTPKLVIVDGGTDLRSPTFFRFPREQWKSIRSTNVIERINEEFRRRVKTQGSFPTEDAGLVLLYALVASSQIKLRKLDGYEVCGEGYVSLAARNWH